MLTLFVSLFEFVGSEALRFSREGGILAEASATLSGGLRSWKAEAFEVELRRGWVDVHAAGLTGGLFQAERAAFAKIISQARRSEVLILSYSCHRLGILRSAEGRLAARRQRAPSTPRRRR